jgi:hypothetical protein
MFSDFDYVLVRAGNDVRWAMFLRVCRVHAARFPWSSCLRRVESVDLAWQNVTEGCDGNLRWCIWMVERAGDSVEWRCGDAVFWNPTQGTLVKQALAGRGEMDGCGLQRHGWDELEMHRQG